MSNIVDLDAVMPQPAVFKLAGREFEVQPPKVSSLLRLGILSGNMLGAETKSDEEVERGIQELTQHIYKMIPELDGQALGMAQLLAIVRAFNDMATPPATKELESRGITPADPKAPED